MPKKIKICDLEMNQLEDTVLLLLAVEGKTTKNGKPFCTLTLTDGECRINANLWNTRPKDLEPFIKTVIWVEITPSMYNGGISYTVHSYQEAPECFHVSDFVLKAPLPPEQMYREIVQMLENVKSDEQSVAGLAIQVYKSFQKKLIYWPAAKSVHHNVYAGLLYHTLYIMKSATAMAGVYHLDMELLLAGAALHDIGKLVELDSDELGAATYSIDGNLFGHTLLGIELINKFNAGNQYDPEQIRQLKHMIASHHGKLEYGAITQPATPEAFLLSQLDRIDARIYSFNEIYKSQEAGTVAEQGVFALDGVRPYKPL